MLARDNHLRRDVALKELKPEQTSSDAARSRFLREAQITGQLEHPGVVPVYELAQRTTDRQHFYTMPRAPITTDVLPVRPTRWSF